MSPIEKTIQTAAFSLEMEGFSVSDEQKALCRKLLLGGITLEQYLETAISNASVK